MGREGFGFWVVKNGSYQHVEVLRHHNGEGQFWASRRRILQTSAADLESDVNCLPKRKEFHFIYNQI